MREQSDPAIGGVTIDRWLGRRLYSVSGSVALMWLAAYEKRRIPWEKSLAMSLSLAP